MKIPGLVGLGLCLAGLAPAAARADVKVDVRFGAAYGPSWGRGACVPRPIYAPPPFARPWCGSVRMPRAVYYPAYPSYYLAPERVVIARETSYAPAPAPTVAETAPGWSALGRNWAFDLRNEVATWEQFVSWLRNNLVRAPSNAYAEFRGGFLAAYGVNAEAAFNKAYAEAR
ncbi:MAG: hypothetical protein IT578_07620 [Verrucomicrobiae bacterium]|nr:hypothetical protein [Verrucomicrobiae bacterium]